VEMPELPTNGFIKTILPTKLVLLIKHTDTIMELDVLHKLNVETVSQIRDAGHNKDQKSTELMSSEMLLENRT